jgi:hypothetical protein
MKDMKRALLGLVACAALFAAPVDDAMAGAPRSGPVLKLHASPLGPVLFSRDSRALYLFTGDSRKRRATAPAGGVAIPLRERPAARRPVVSIPTSSGRTGTGRWFALGAEGRAPS